ncbi:hypothetical protein L1987_24981 [Smallanthus sonchifolius]|uniref:Uncharacterized protein n=1 Tax=Smallanthus sonchifolius TaxID=185202 RepID=A0ACB9INP9_9ASTR|nr:hypothetical protein L1987_24981 [Smallanthus sonchifolius]
MKENVEVGSVTPGICQLQGRNQLKDLVKKINPVSKESGGLSGKPLFSLSNGILTDMYILTKGKIPLVGYGGVSSICIWWTCPYTSDKV